MFCCRLQKLFLVALSFNLVQKNEALSQLFKTAVFVRNMLLFICEGFGADSIDL